MTRVYFNILPDISIFLCRKNLSHYVEKEIHKNNNSKWWAASEQTTSYINWQNYLEDVVRLAQKCLLLKNLPTALCFYFESQ